MASDKQSGARPRAHGALAAAFLVFCGALGALHLAGRMFPRGMSWGFSHLAYLPGVVTPLYVALLCATLLAAWRGWLNEPLRRVALWADAHGWSFGAVSAALVLFLSVPFHIGAPLLGDSFTYIRNLTDAFAGTYPLGVWHEPLAMYSYYGALKLLGSTSEAGVIGAYVALDALCAVVYAVAVTRAVRLLVDDPQERFLAAVWALVMPTTLFFFGYVEIYALTLTALALYLWLSLAVLAGRVRFIILPPALLLMVFLHYLNGLLGIALLYVAYREHRRGRTAEVLVGCAIAAAGAIGVFAAVGFEIGRLMDQSPISHFLSLGTDISKFNAYSQAFTLLSWNHAVELANFALLMFPCALFLLVVIGARRARLVAESPRASMLALIIVPYVLLIALTKIQQGMGNDWDVTAGYFALFTLGTVALLAAAFGAEERRRLLLLAVGTTAVHSLLWFAMNTDADASVRRIEELLDRRMVSQLGQYTITLHLVRYDEYRGDSLAPPERWQRYSYDFPDDPRGYANTIEALRRAHDPNATRMVAFYDRWMAIDPSNAELRRKCFELCTQTGSALFAADSVKAAIPFFERAVLLEPRSAAASTNLGGALAGDGRTELAVRFLKEAIAIDSAYSDAYFNLAMVYEDMGRAAESATALRKAASLGNQAAMSYLARGAARGGGR